MRDEWTSGVHRESAHGRDGALALKMLAQFSASPRRGVEDPGKCLDRSSSSVPSQPVTGGRNNGEEQAPSQGFATAGRLLAPFEQA